ncbi:carbamate kinase [Cuniculiplasma sp. SKW3]|uniref:carbamate kinase n=1 Tax=unclassified Cuniculiplasma TaxID=2619706 RepID=UPI003FD35B6A
MKRLVIALGGNALLMNGDRRDYETQVKHAYDALNSLSDVIEKEDVIITHGNGPQVGDIFLRNQDEENMPPGMPLHACGAMSQGLIGEMILEAFEKVKKEKGLGKDVSVILTRTLVDKNDPGFQNPSKPVGQVFTESEKEKLEKEKGWKFTKTEKGWRRVVPSPFPRDILEKRAIESNLISGFIPVCVGGGGIPVIEDGNRYSGVEAVIDKDLASAVLAYMLECEEFLILTDVPNVYINFGKPDQKALENVTLKEIENYMSENQFGKGSMGPKVNAAITFLKHGGKIARIGDLKDAINVYKGKSGTHVSVN